MNFAHDENNGFQNVLIRSFDLNLLVLR